MSLIIQDLHARVKDGAEILNGINLEIPKGEVHAIMGPNGSGKSTLSKVLCGHPDYEVTGGRAEMDGQDLLAMSVDERSRAGLFLAFQYPVEVPGVTNANFLRAALSARLPEGESFDSVAFYKSLRARMKQLGMDPKFTARAVNEGFSGGDAAPDDGGGVVRLGLAHELGAHGGQGDVPADGHVGEEVEVLEHHAHLLV